MLYPYGIKPLKKSKFTDSIEKEDNGGNDSFLYRSEVKVTLHVFQYYAGWKSNFVVTGLTVAFGNDYHLHVVISDIFPYTQTIEQYEYPIFWLFILI